MNKASGGDRIPVELFQVLKDDSVKVLHSICQQIWKTQQWPKGLKKVSFHSNPKERQCQRKFKLPHNCTHLTCQQSNVQNSPNKASVVHEPRTSRCSGWIQKRQRNQRSNCQYLLDHTKSKTIPEKTSTSALLIVPKPLTVWITTNCEKFKSEVSQLCLPLCNPIDSNLQIFPLMGFSRQEYQGGLPFPSPEDLPEPGIEARSPTLQADILPSEQLGKPKEMGISDHLTFLLRNLYAGQEATVRSEQQQLEHGTKTGSKLGKEYIKAVYFHPAYLTCMQSTSCKIHSWMKNKLKSDCWDKYQ